MVIERLKTNGKGKITLLASKIKPEKFGLDDVAQQIFGAVLFSIPLSVTEEVWTLAGELTSIKLIVFILLSIGLSALIIYYTKFQKVAKEPIGGEIDTHIMGKTYVPRRLVSVFLIAYAVSFFILWLFGVMDHIGNAYWSLKIVIFVSFFVLFVLAVFLMSRKGVVSLFLRPLFNRMVPERYKDRFSLTFEEFYRGLEKARKRKGLIVYAFLLGFLNYVIAIVQYYLVVAGMGIDITFLFLFSLYSRFLMQMWLLISLHLLLPLDF